MKNKIGVVIVVLLILIFSIFAFKWIKERREFAITDAVFVETDSLSNLSFKQVSGKIVAMYKEEGDPVKKGELIAKIDDTDYQLKRKQIKEQIKSLRFKKQALQAKKERVSKQIPADIKISQLDIKNLTYTEKALLHSISAVESQIKKLKKDLNRYKPLVEEQLFPKAKYEELATKLAVLVEKKKGLEEQLKQLNVKKAQLKEKLEIVKAKKIQIREIENQIKSVNSNLASLKHRQEEVEKLIEYTTLKAPFNGYIAKKFRSVGEVIAAGMPVYAEVPPPKKDNYYILVLLEETKLEGIKVGSKAYIKIDAYPDLEFEGLVKEINPTTAAKFALVPRDITAGEFTKVVQRIPVKIQITKGNVSVLRVGMGGEVKIKRHE